MYLVRNWKRTGDAGKMCIRDSRLYEPTGGRIIYDDKVIFDKEKKIAENMLPYRKKMQIVFQDPYASLDPRMTVGDIVGEPIDIHHLASSKQERYDMIIEMLRRVGLKMCIRDRLLIPRHLSGISAKVLSAVLWRLSDVFFLHWSLS